MTTALQSMSHWEGPATALWKQALKSTAPAKSGGWMSTELSFSRMLNAFASWPMRRVAAAALIMIAATAIIIAVMQEVAMDQHRRELGGGVALEYAMREPVVSAPARSQYGRAVPTSAAEYNDRSVELFANDNLAGDSAVLRAPGPSSAGGIRTGAGAGGGAWTNWPDSDEFEGGGLRSPGADGMWDSSNTEPIPTDRMVVQKASIDLVVENVRTAFLKATQLISEAHGEYIETSGLIGSDERQQAELTLRVTAERLSAILNDLRTLGEVAAESLKGDDVTAQVVDIEARIAAELRLERELVALMESRQDAKLEEILQLHNQVSAVRTRIEQMTAQRQRLGRMVSLATILVIIHPMPEKEPEPEPAKVEPEQTLGSYFSEQVGKGWTGGLMFLSDCIAGVVRVLVGGLVWWLIALGAVFVGKVMLARRTAVA